MTGCNTGRNIQKYKGGGASTLQDALENGNTASLNINLSSPAVFVGDGGGLSNINASATSGNLQAVTDNAATTTNKITLTNGLTSLVTSGNVLVTGNVTASFFRGDGGTLSNVAANKNFQEVTDFGSTSSNKITLTNGVTSLQASGNVSVTGNVTASKFYGDGRTLTGVALSTDLASNSTRIGTVSTDLTSNASRIGVVETDLASNSTRIGTVSTDLTSNASRIGVVETDLASNASRIGVVETDLTSNASRIGVVETDLASNSADLASNASRIGVLETDLASNVSRIGDLETDLTSNTSRIGVVETDLASNSTRIGTVSTDLTSNASRIGVVETDLASNSTRIGTVSTDLASNSTRISTVSTDLADNSTRIGTVSTDLTDNASRINTLESETQPVTRGGTNLTSFAKGDIIIASDTDELNNLILGTGGHVLTANSSTSLPEWRSAGDIGATVETHSNGSYILGGAFTGADTVTWSIQASTSNLSDYIVVRDSSGDINVSNINAIEYYGDGGTLSNIVGSQDLQAVIDQDPYTSSAAYFGGGLYGEIKGSNTINAHTLSSLELYGEIKGSNAISSSTVNAITLNANVNAGNVVSTDIYGTIKGSNAINAHTLSSLELYGEVKGSNAISSSTVNAITLNANVNAGNVVSTDIYGTIQGSNAISSSTVNAITLTGNVNAGNVVTSDGRGIDQLNASNINTGNVLIARGGTGLEAVAENELLLGPSSGTALTKLSPYTTDSTKKFLRSNNDGVAWDDVSSATIVTTNEGSSPGDHGLIFVANASAGAQALLKDSSGSSFGTLKYKPSTGTLTTSNIVTSDTSIHARNGIANTTPTHTLDIGSNVAVIDDGIDKLYIRGNVYSTHDIISLGTVRCKEIIAVNSKIKNSEVVTEAPTRQVRSI